MMSRALPLACSLPPPISPEALMGQVEQRIEDLML